MFCTVFFFCMISACKVRIIAVSFFSYSCNIVVKYNLDSLSMYPELLHVSVSFPRTIQCAKCNSHCADPELL
jgi:hypothetical protein